MPAYQTSGPITAIYPGDSVALVNDATVDSGITDTMQVAIAPPPGDGYQLITVFNLTDKTCDIQAAPHDIDADYVTYYPVDAGKQVQPNLPIPFLRAHFAVAPTTGSLIVSA